MHVAKSPELKELWAFWHVRLRLAKLAIMRRRTFEFSLFWR
jgi:hypothetical protein